MTKVYEHKARKDYPQFGIAKGDTYYEWAFFRQKPTKSKTYPTRIQLTQNDTQIAVWSVYDQCGIDWSERNAATLAEAVNDAASQLEEAASECREKFDNMPEGLQQGDTGQRLEQWADAIDSAVSELQDLASEIENADEDIDFAAFEEQFGATEPDLS